MCSIVSGSTIYSIKINIQEIKFRNKFVLELYQCRNSYLIGIINKDCKVSLTNIET